MTGTMVASNSPDHQQQRTEFCQQPDELGKEQKYPDENTKRTKKARYKPGIYKCRQRTGRESKLII